MTLFDQQFAAAVDGAYFLDGTVPSTALAPSGVTATVYGDGAHVAAFAVNAEGQVTSAGNIAIAIAASQVSGISPISTYVATRAAMAALVAANNPVVILEEAGRQGTFVWSGTNLSGFVALDTLQGIYVAPASDTTGASGCWVRVYGDNFDIRWFGAVSGAGVGDQQPAIQCAVNVAAGFPVFIPIGAFRLDSGISYAGPVVMYGVGNGSGPGAVLNTNCSQLLPNFANGDVVSASTIYQCIFKNFQINSNTGLRASGAGIHISGNGGNNANSIIDGVAFSNQYVGIQQTDCSENIVTNTYHQAWSRSAFMNGSTGAEVGPGAIFNNYFFGQTNSSATQTACIELYSGYAHIYDNLMLGAQFGVRGIINQTDSGNPHIHHNWIEEQAISGIYFSNANSKNMSMLQIDNNEMSNVGNTANYQGGIVIVAGSVNWIDCIQITGNTIRSSFTAGSVFFINVQSGKNVLVANNVLINLNSYASAYAFLTGAQVASPMLFSGNVTLNFAANRRYAIGNTVPTIVDDLPLTLAEILGLTPANGSRIFASDGSGTQMVYLNGAWAVTAAEQVTVLATDFAGANVNTAQPVFSSGQSVLTVAALTTYEFEAEYQIDTTGATSHSLGILFALGGGASLTSIAYEASATNGAARSTPSAPAVSRFEAATVSTVTAAVAAATQNTVRLRGIIRMNAAGTITPQFQYSAVPGAIPTVRANSFFRLWPIGLNTVASVGAWS